MYPNTYDCLSVEELTRPRPLACAGAVLLSYARVATNACPPERLEKCQQRFATKYKQLSIIAKIFASVAFLDSYLEHLEVDNDQLKTSLTHFKGVVVEYSGYTKSQKAIAKSLK